MTKTVLIFHPDLELSLVHFQRELTKSLNQSFFSKQNSEKSRFLQQNKVSQQNIFLQENTLSQAENFFYTPLPLWLELNHDIFFCENKSQLKKLSYCINNVYLLENLKVVENSVNITAKINMKNLHSPKPENIDFFFDLPVSKLHNCNKLTDENHKIITNTKNPINDIKIFRLGICRQLSANSKEIEDFVWAKKNS